MIQSPHILLCQTEKRAKIGIADVKCILNISLFQIFYVIIIVILFPDYEKTGRNSKVFEDILQDQFFTSTASVV